MGGCATRGCTNEAPPRFSKCADCLTGGAQRRKLAGQLAAVKALPPLEVSSEGFGFRVPGSPVSWNNADALASLKLPNDANLIVTVHNYSPFNFTHQGANWVTPMLPLGVTCCNAQQQAELAAPLEIARKWSAANAYPVFLGEFGAYEAGDMTSRVRFTRLMRDAAESRGITWAYWEMAAGFGVYDPAAHTFRVQLRDALLGAQPVASVEHGR